MKARERQGFESKKQSCLQVQKDILNKALCSNESGPTWKILVFDSYNRAIVSSQFKMKDLRDHNITLYLNLQESREQIHGVTILYLIQPTLENIEIIIKDLLDDLYNSVYIHFSSEPSLNILSTLAKRLSESKKTSTISRILKIEYSCIGYYPIDHSMCVLPSEVEIVNMLAAMSYQPIFVFNPLNEQSKNLVEKIKNKLTSITETLKNQTSLSLNNNYVIFYIFNRETDLFPLLAHGITYASLLENFYKVTKNGTKVSKNENSKEMAELSLQDDIWVNKKNYLISEMKLKEESNKIQSSMISLSSEEYTESNEKFKKIEWHLNNAGEMLGEAAKRRLNEFYEAEKDIYYKALVSGETKRDILTLLKEGINSEDKVRLLLIYILYVDSIDDFKEFEQVFPDIIKNKKYCEAKDKKLRGSVVESSSNKYLKKFAKGIWKNIVSGDKKFRISKELEKVKSTDFTELIESGLAVESINEIPSNIKIQRNIVYSLGGVCFHEYANVMEFDPDAMYTGDQFISYRDAI